MSVDDLVLTDERDTTSRATAGSQGWAGQIETTAANLTDDVMVTIPGIGNGRYKYGPCGWMPRDSTYPTAGDSCLVIFDDEQTPWIAAWTPS